MTSLLIDRYEDGQRYAEMTLELSLRYFQTRFSEALSALGWAQLHLGEVEEGIRNLESVAFGADSVSSFTGNDFSLSEEIPTEPGRGTFPDLWIAFGLAKGYADTGRTAEAAEMLERALWFGAPGRRSSAELLLRYHRGAVEVATSAGLDELADQHRAKAETIRDRLATDS